MGEVLLSSMFDCIQPPSLIFTSSSRTAFGDFCPDRFLWATRFLFLVFPYFFGFCAVRYTKLAISSAFVRTYLRIVTLLNLYALYKKTLMYVCMYVSKYIVSYRISVQISQKCMSNFLCYQWPWLRQYCNMLLTSGVVVLWITSCLT